MALYRVPHTFMYFLYLRFRIFDNKRILLDRIFEAISRNSAIFSKKNLKHFQRYTRARFFSHLPGYGEQSATMLYKDHVKSVTRDENNEHEKQTESQVYLNVIVIFRIILNEIITWYRIYHWWRRILLFYHVNQTPRPWHLNEKEETHAPVC